MTSAIERTVVAGTRIAASALPDGPLAWAGRQVGTLQVATSSGGVRNIKLMAPTDTSAMTAVGKFFPDARTKATPVVWDAHKGTATALMVDRTGEHYLVPLSTSRGGRVQIPVDSQLAGPHKQTIAVIGEETQFDLRPLEQQLRESAFETPLPSPAAPSLAGDAAAVEAPQIGGIGLNTTDSSIAGLLQESIPIAVARRSGGGSMAVPGINEEKLRGELLVTSQSEGAKRITGATAIDDARQAARSLALHDGQARSVVRVSDEEAVVAPTSAVIRETGRGHDNGHKHPWFGNDKQEYRRWIPEYGNLGFPPPVALKIEGSEPAIGRAVAAARAGRKDLVSIVGAHNELVPGFGGGLKLQSLPALANDQPIAFSRRLVIDGTVAGRRLEGRVAALGTQGTVLYVGDDAAAARSVVLASASAGTPATSMTMSDGRHLAATVEGVDAADLKRASITSTAPELNLLAVDDLTVERGRDGTVSKNFRTEGDVRSGGLAGLLGR